MYIIYIVEGTKQTSYIVGGCEAAFNAYRSAVAFMEAVGAEAKVELVDAETAEIIADSDDD